MQSSQQAKDIERFKHFSSGYVAVDSANLNKVVDIRYSLLPQEIAPLWGILLDENKKHDEHAEYLTNRAEPGNALSRLVSMLIEWSGGGTGRFVVQTARLR